MDKPLFARFAQEKGGQRLHIVEADANDKSLAFRAICGRNCLGNGRWRMTINLPMGNLCQNCGKISNTYPRQIKIVEF